MKNSSSRISAKKFFTLRRREVGTSSSAPDLLSKLFHDASITAGTSTTAISTSTSAMPSTPNARCTPNALIHVQLPWNWNRSAPGLVSNLNASTSA